MQITDSAKQAIEGILHQNDAKGIRIYFAGMG